MTADLRSISLVVLALLCAGACRDSSGGGSQGVNLVPSSFAANGCTGPNQAFTAGQVPVAVPLASLSIGPFSQLTAAGDSETLFATGAGATLVQIDVSAALAVETVLLAPGVVDALLATAGIGVPAELSGLCVLDAGALLVIEHTSNTVLLVDRLGLAAPLFFAGLPDVAGGFADGTALAFPGAGQARFDFDAPTQLLSTDPLLGFVFVADRSNHAIRRIASGFVDTVAGSGAPFFADGDIQQAGFDSPNGLSVTCTGTLFVTESGDAGIGGHRLRQLLLGPETFLGLSGSVVTRAGNGVDSTLQGDNQAAALAAPVSPLVTSEGDTYWIDSSTGILRRMGGPSDTCDCPLWADCTAAVAGGGDFTPGGSLSLTQTPGGALFVLDATAGVLWRVTP